MPMLRFVTLDGDRIVEELFLDNELMPAVGDVVEVDGIRCRRVLNSFRPGVKPTRHFRSRQLPKNYAPHAAAGGKFDVEGRCLFDSMKQVRETEAAIADSADSAYIHGYDKE